MFKALLFFLSVIMCVCALANSDSGLVRDTIPKKDSSKTISIEQWLLESDTSEKESSVFEKVEIAPAVDSKLWMRHIQNSFKNFTDSSGAKNIPAGTYKIQVRFLVNTDGTVKDVDAVNDPGYGLKELAIKIVKSGPKWRPAVQNGRIVRAYYTQPIVLVIDEAQK